MGLNLINFIISFLFSLLVLSLAAALLVSAKPLLPLNLLFLATLALLRSPFHQPLVFWTLYSHLPGPSLAPSWRLFLLAPDIVQSQEETKIYLLNRVFKKRSSQCLNIQWGPLNADSWYRRHRNTHYVLDACDIQTPYRTNSYPDHFETPHTPNMYFWVNPLISNTHLSWQQTYRWWYQLECWS